MREDNKIFCWGICALVFGAAGIAEHVTSERGSFPVCAVVFGIGLVLICWSYVYGRK